MRLNISVVRGAGKGRERGEEGEGKEGGDVWAAGKSERCGGRLAEGRGGGGERGCWVAWVVNVVSGGRGRKGGRSQEKEIVAGK